MQSRRFGSSLGYKVFIHIINIKIPLRPRGNDNIMRTFATITVLNGAECFNFSNGTIEYNGAEACRIKVAQTTENFSELLKLGVSFSLCDGEVYCFILDSWKDIAGMR